MKNLIREGTLNLPLAFFFSAIIFGGFLLLTQEVEAQYGSCSEYGIMAYESGGYCKCMSGYVFDTNMFGDEQCVSADSICRDEYGVMSRYNSLSGNCECSYGYTLGEDSIGRTQCISDTEACQNQLGYNATASGGQCKCRYGYVIDTNMFGDQQCTDGDQFCLSEHGYRSSYDSLSNECECDSGYTFDDDYQCVEKHNSAYFDLLDISKDGDKLLIQSQYDYQNYVIEFGLGCWDYAIESYEGGRLVINMGTDFSVDMFDTLVLPDHDQNCSIMSVDWTLDDSFPEPEEDTSYYTPVAQRYSPSSISPKLFVPEPTTYLPEVDTTEAIGLKDELFDNNDGEEDQYSSSTIDEAVDVEIQVSSEDGAKESFFKRIVSFFRSWF